MQILAEDQIIANFFKGCFCNIVMSDFVLQSLPFEALRNICRYGDCCAANLPGKRVFFWLWKRVCKLINHENQFMCLLPCQ